MKLRARARDILGLDIKGFTVHKVLVDPGVVIQDEIYLAILLDRAARRPMIMASAAGGMDIEAVAEETPEKIIKVHINPQIGVRTFHSTYIASRGIAPRVVGPVPQRRDESIRLLHQQRRVIDRDQPTDHRRRRQFDGG